MKTHPIKLSTCLGMTAGLGVALVSQVKAIDAPPDDAPPPAPVAGAQNAKDPAQEEPAIEQKKEATAYLGVVSSPVPNILAEHLNLKPGEGIMVRSVLPDGPAAKAGLAPNDIITHFAGEPIDNAADLSAFVSGHRPGDKIEIDLIHKGRDTKVEAVLGERPNDLAMRGVAPQPLDELNLDGMPNDIADRIRGMIEGNIGGLELENNLPGGAPRMDEAMREMRKRMENAMQDLNAGIPNVNAGVAATVRMMDENGSIELKSSNDGKEVTVRDADNKVTWTGPWDTEQDKAAAPDDVRERVERLNIEQANGNGIRLRMGGPLQIPQHERE